jgi:hypothetical protein
VLKFPSEYINTAMVAFAQRLQKNCILQMWTEKATAPGWALGGVPSEIEKPALVRGLLRLCGEHGSYFGAANSFAKLHGDRAMTSKAKGSNVIEVALAATFCNGQNVIGIP